MRRLPNDDSDRLALSEVDAALRLLCDNPADFARAKSLARARAAGLIDYSAEDLLQEAFVKLLSGERRWPRNVHPLVVLTTAMHGIASNIRKRTDKGAINRHVAVSAAEGELENGQEIVAVERVTPVENANATSELAEIQRLVAGDEDAELVVLAWADGLRGKEAADELGFDMKKYEAARKRLIRKLEPVQALRRES